MSHYLLIHCVCSVEFSEILLAELAENDYTAFLETSEGLQVFIPANAFDETVFKDLQSQYQNQYDWSYSVEKFTGQSWQDHAQMGLQGPLVLGEQLIILQEGLEFTHNYPYEILIDSRATFGSGHHPSTIACIENLLDLSSRAKSVLDIGTGSGILAIIASKVGFTSIDALDNNPWAVEACQKNIHLNTSHEVAVYEGGIDSTSLSKTYDLILANLNAQVLSQELNQYVQKLNQGGQMILGGYLGKDEDLIHQMALSLGLKLQKRLEKDQWISCVYYL